MGGKLYGKLFAGFQIPDTDSGQADGFHIEFHGIDSFFSWLTETAFTVPLIL